MRYRAAADLPGNGDGWRNRKGSEASAGVRGARLVVSKKRSHYPRAPRKVLCTDGDSKSSAASRSWRRSRRWRSSWMSRRCSSAFWNWRERRAPCRPSVARARWASTMSKSMRACSVGGLVARESSSASKIRDAVEAPGGVGDFVDELSLGGGGGFVLIEKLLDVALVGFGVLGGQDGSVGGETMAEGVERRTLLARFGARAGGV